MPPEQPDDSHGTVTEMPPGVDPLDELEALETGQLPPGQADDQGQGQADAGTGEPPAHAGEPAAQQSDGTQQAADDDWLRPGQFRDGQAAVEAYDNVRREHGRQADEIGQLRSRLAAYEATGFAPQPQGYQQQPVPQAFGGQQMQPAPQPGLMSQQLPQLSNEQLEELAMTDPMRAIDYIATARAQQATEQALAQIVPAIAPLIEGQNRVEAQGTISRLQARFGDDVIGRHRETLASVIQADEAYFLPEETRYQRAEQVIKALEFDRLQHPSATQPRQNGQFAPRQVHHTEGGSDGHNPPGTGGAAPVETDPDLADWDSDRGTADRFGRRPPGYAAASARRMAG
jgi:hypothetical protein